MSLTPFTARVLHYKLQVLILDKANSALDNLTEHVVMEGVNNLGHEITIILIAHRLSTERQCDRVFLLDKGQVKVHGSYDELMASNSIFQRMAGVVS